MGYFELEEPLDYRQRQATEQRILHDALLIRDGTHITELGTLAVTWIQIEKARLTGNPLYSLDVVRNEDLESWLMDVFPEDRPKGEKEWLDEPLQSTMKRVYPSSHAPYFLETARDALAIGRTKTQAMYGVGKKTMEKLEGLMGGNEHFEWKDEPTIEDIAQYCNWLSQVPALATLPQELIQEGATVGNMSVIDVLNTPEEDRDKLAGKLGYIEKYLISGKIRDRVVREVYGEIELFAIKFESLKSSDAEVEIDLEYLQQDSTKDLGD